MQKHGRLHIEVSDLEAAMTTIRSLCGRMLVWTVLVLCGTGLLLQDSVREYAYYLFGLSLRKEEWSFLFMGLVNAAYALILLLKLTAAVWRRFKAPPGGSVSRLAREWVVWLLILFCAAGLCLTEGEDISAFFLIAANAVYVLVLLIRMFAALARGQRKPEARVRHPGAPTIPSRPIDPESASPARPKYCSACGAGLEPGDRYCPQCGQELSGPSPEGEPA